MLAGDAHPYFLSLNQTSSGHLLGPFLDDFPIKNLHSVSFSSGFAQLAMFDDYRGY